MRKYLIPAFGGTPLRDMSPLKLQQYFSDLGASALSGSTVLKIKEVLSSVLSSAVAYELLAKNPMLALRIHIYAQHVPTSQRRAVTKTMEMVRSRQARKDVPSTFQKTTVFDDGCDQNDGAK